MWCVIPADHCELGGTAEPLPEVAFTSRGIVDARADSHE
jgi:hypothetical protein